MSLSKMINFARTAFRKHPLATNSFVYGALYVGAEFSQQTLTRKFLHDGQPLSYDIHMISRFGIFGLAVYPQVYYYWYKWLDNKYVGTSLRIVGKKLLLDQFVLTPPLLVIFFVGMSIMERKTNYLEECQNKILPTFKTSCLFWLPAQAVNFLLVPPAFRVIYVGSCALVWCNILCWIKRQDY